MFYWIIAILAWTKIVSENVSIYERPPELTFWFEQNKWDVNVRYLTVHLLIIIFKITVSAVSFKATQLLQAQLLCQKVVL